MAASTTATVCVYDSGHHSTSMAEALQTTECIGRYFQKFTNEVKRVKRQVTRKMRFEMVLRQFRHQNSDIKISKNSYEIDASNDTE